MSEGAFDAGARRRIAEQLATGSPPRCPECGGELSLSPLAPPPDVPYVRRRVLVICSRCRRSASLDAPP